MKLICLAVFAVALLVFLIVQIEMRSAGIQHDDLMELFDGGAAGMDLQCTSCTQYFGDGLSLTDPNILPIYADTQLTLLNSALDGLIAFIKDKNKFCDEPPQDVASYTTCLNRYIATTVMDPCVTDGTGADAVNGRNKVKCAILQTLVDEIMSKATVCIAECDDVKKYPREDERLQCKKTGQCNNLDELEGNIKKYVDLARAQFLTCKTALSDSTSTCYQYFAKAIKTKQDSAKALAAAYQKTAEGPKLATLYGDNPVTFDLATLLLANS